MPVVLFLHGLGGSKEQDGQRLRDLAARGFFVVAIDAYLHGERKVPGIFAPGKKMGDLGEDYSIWVHQSSVSHTARDVSKIIDALSARGDVDTSRIRSEEHTSELQSLTNLVCRLLLEKKKN